MFGSVPHITAPTLMVIAEVDEMEGADGHFGVITLNSPDLGRSLQAQQRFVRQHLIA